MLLLLASCTSPSPAPPPLKGTLGPGAAWSVTQGTNPRAISGGSFVMASSGHDDYVEAGVSGALALGGSYSLTYTISGDNPAWIVPAPGACTPVVPQLRLLLHQAGDNWSGAGAFETYRWYSTTAVPLALGTRTVVVGLALGNWTDVLGQQTDAAGFAAAFGSIGSLGFVFGGGCFAGHGVAVSSGTATFSIGGATID